MNPATTDPESLSTLASLYQHGLYIPLVILVGYFALRWLSQHVAWLETGKRAAYVAALLGGIATLVGPAANGTTPNASMLIAAVVSVLTLLTSPIKAAKQAGSVLVLLFAITAAAPGCKSAVVKQVESTATNAARDAWDCTKQEESSLTAGKSWLAIGIAVATKFAELVAADGADPIAIAEALGAQYGEPIVACVLKELSSGPPAAGSGSGSSSSLVAARPPSAAATAAGLVIAAHHWSYK